MPASRKRSIHLVGLTSIVFIESIDCARRVSRLPEFDQPQPLTGDVLGIDALSQGLNWREVQHTGAASSLAIAMMAGGCRASRLVLMAPFRRLIQQNWDLRFG